MRVRQDLESFKRSWFDIIFSRNEIIQGTIREGKQTYTFLLNVQKAFVLVIEVGCGEIIIKAMYDIALSAVLLEGLKSKSFNIGRVVRVVICLLSCMYFPISC